MPVKLLSRLQVRHLYPLLPLALSAVIAVAPMRDNSFLWHVRAGSVQLAATRVLSSDPFSYVTEGDTWRTQSWLAELFYAFAESLFGGVNWAPMMIGTVVIGTLSVSALAIYANSRSPFSTAAWLLVMTWLLVPFIQPRPVVFSYLLLATLVGTLALGDRTSWAVVPIMWIWAGIHGSWIIGLCLVVLVATSRRSLRIAAAGAVAAAVTAATAHGIGTWVILLSFARSSAALKYMEEWHAPDFSSIVQAPYLLILVGLLLAAVKGRIAISDLWVIFPFMLAGFMSQRMVPVAALVLLPFAARSIRVVLPASAARHPAVPWIVLSTVFVITVAVCALPREEFEAGRFPSDAAITAAGPSRFFHDDVVGGYLIYRSGPERLVYLDDRAELYGAGRLAEFVAVRDGNYRAVFDRLGMTAALVRRDWPLRATLLRDGWRVEYRDLYFEVLVSGRR